MGFAIATMFLHSATMFLQRAGEMVVQMRILKSVVQIQLWCDVPMAFGFINRLGNARDPRTAIYVYLK